MSYVHLKKKPPRFVGIIILGFFWIPTKIWIYFTKNKTVRLYSPKLAAASKGLVKSKGFLIRLLKL